LPFLNRAAVISRLKNDPDRRSGAVFYDDQETAACSARPDRTGRSEHCIFRNVSFHQLNKVLISVVPQKHFIAGTNKAQLPLLRAGVQFPTSGVWPTELYEIKVTNSVPLIKYQMIPSMIRTEIIGREIFMPDSFAIFRHQSASFFFCRP